MNQTEYPNIPRCLLEDDEEQVRTSEQLKVSIWTDGTCWPNPGPRGGWAAVIKRNGETVELSGRIQGICTNNRAELTAAIRALHSLTEPSVVDLFTDSQYLRTGGAEWRKGWKKRGYLRKCKQPPGVELVPNADLWREIDRLCEKHHVRWHWVRGHANCAENIRCDALAEAALKM